ncbi:Holliday junction branch migration protein RuvA [Candidatus Ventrimonas sp. KK005]
MFSYIKGPLTEILEEDSTIVVEAGNIGWNVHVPLSVLDRLPRIGEPVQIYTFFQVREDGMNLYGFLSRPDLKMFRMLLGVNGIGPKAALGILSAVGTENLRIAIVSEDVKAISCAPGVGAKTAKRVILDLKDKIPTEDLLPGGVVLGDLGVGNGDTAFGGETGASREAVEALVALGYSMSEAAKAVRQVEMADGMTAEAVLKASLKYLI